MRRAILALLLVGLAAAAEDAVPTEVPGVPTDNPRTGVVYKLRVVGKNKCPKENLLHAPVCTYDEPAYNGVLLGGEFPISHTSWGVQTDRQSAIGISVLNGTPFFLRNWGRLRERCTWFLKAQSKAVCANRNVWMGGSQMQWSLGQVRGQPTKFYIRAKSRNACALKWLGVKNSCNAVESTPRLYSAPQGLPQGTLLKWEFLPVCVEKNFACSPNGPIGCCLDQGLTCKPRRNGSGYTCQP